MYYGRGHGISEQLEEAKSRAREARVLANRAASCGACLVESLTTEEELAEA